MPNPADAPTRNVPSKPFFTPRLKCQIAMAVIALVTLVAIAMIVEGGLTLYDPSKFGIGELAKVGPWAPGLMIGVGALVAFVGIINLLEGRKSLRYLYPPREEPASLDQAATRPNQSGTNIVTVAVAPQSESPLEQARADILYGYLRDDEAWAYTLSTGERVIKYKSDIHRLCITYIFKGGLCHIKATPRDKTTHETFEDISALYPKKITTSELEKRASSSST